MTQSAELLPQGPGADPYADITHVTTAPPRASALAAACTLGVLQHALWARDTTPSRASALGAARGCEACAPPALAAVTAVTAVTVGSVSAPLMSSTEPSMSHTPTCVLGCVISGVGCRV